MEINNYYYFPEEISINILSRLPTVSVVQCSLVCKSWGNLILYNRQFVREFPRMHLLRGLESHHGRASTGRVNFLLVSTDTGCKKGIHYTLDGDNYEKGIPVFRALRTNPNPYNKNKFYVVGSCNGLICMAYAIGSVPDHRGFEQPIYICNPITREWLTLPSLTFNYEFCCSALRRNNDPIHLSKFRRVLCGFGYLPTTDEYKVVRITYCLHRGYPVGQVQVYTLGDGTGWRDKGETTYELTYHVNSPCILANGALHWLEEKDRKIVAFDLTDEEFLFLPSPPCFLPYDDMDYPFEIKVLGGQLCAFHYKESLTVGMWFYKNKKEEKNDNKKDGNGRREYQFWSWIKEYDLELTGLDDGIYHPFILTKNGDVLYYSYTRLFLYEFKTATSKELVDMNRYLSEFYRFEAIPYLNSFISLKALGEEDTKIIE